ncbi:hypothetical protein J1614_012186 [Plenodomus biglobosus]|nr:hypothetical protein J1614_012186 [Plenodomus biglobosus]
MCAIHKNVWGRSNPRDGSPLRGERSRTHPTSLVATFSPRCPGLIIEEHLSSPSGAPAQPGFTAVNPPDPQIPPAYPELGVPGIDTECEGASQHVPHEVSPLPDMFRDDSSPVLDEDHSLDRLLSAKADKIFEETRRGEEIAPPTRGSSPPRRNLRARKTRSVKLSMDGNSSEHGDPEDQDEEEIHNTGTPGASKTPKKSIRSSKNVLASETGTPRTKRGGANIQYRGVRRADPCFRCVRSAISGQSGGECYEQTKDLGTRCERCIGHSCVKVPESVRQLSDTFLQELHGSARALLLEYYRSQLRLWNADATGGQVLPGNLPRYHPSTDPAHIKKFNKGLKDLLPPERASSPVPEPVPTVPKTPASKKKGRKKFLSPEPSPSDAPETPVPSKKNRASVEDSPSPVPKRVKVSIEDVPGVPPSAKDERRDSGVPSLPERSFSRSSTFAPTSFGRAQEDPYTDYGVPARDLSQTTSRWGTPNSGYMSSSTFGSNPFPGGGFSARPPFGYQAPHGRIITDEQRGQIFEHVQVVNGMVREISARLDDIANILK